MEKQTNLSIIRDRIRQSEYGMVIVKFHLYKELVPLTHSQQQSWFPHVTLPALLPVPCHLPMNIFATSGSNEHKWKIGTNTQSQQ